MSVLQEAHPDEVLNVPVSPRYTLGRLDEGVHPLSESIGDLIVVPQQYVLLPVV